MGTLIILLAWEHYSLRRQVEKLHILQDQYHGYIDSVKRMLRRQKAQHDEVASKAVSDEEENAGSFLLINRKPEYLKKSALSYAKQQQLDSLFAHINKHEWDGYTKQVLRNDNRTRKAQKKLNKRRVARRRGSAAMARKRWPSVSCIHRESLTGINFICPIERTHFYLSSFFGVPRRRSSGRIGFHLGIDMATQRGTAVSAAAGGTVEYAGYAPGYGNTVVLVHDAVYKTRYAHLDEIYVRAHQAVGQGKRVGSVGDTGFTIKRGRDASHLHFEIYEHGKQVNPLALLVL